MKKLQPISWISKKRAQIIFSGDDFSKIKFTLVRVALYEPDYKWATAQCLNFCDHADGEIRGLAAACLGHIGRVHGTIEMEKVIPVLERLLQDTQTVGRAEDALGDIKQFVRRRRH
ncbi:MAG: uncharacterized protein JWN25_3580 [Verrucomicrobiales bacterium]|nr:uncharacterized protein [Verrucomicrobiales bacterium]